MFVKLVFYFHLIGLSSLLGGLLVQMKASEKKIIPAMTHGLMTLFATGLILAGLKGADISVMKILTKLILLLIIFGIMTRNKNQVLLPGTFMILMGLTLAAMGVAVFW